MKSSKTLCLDFGNTRKKYAVIDNGEVQVVEVLDDDSDATIRNLIDRFQPKKAILSSVVNHSTGIEDVLASKLKFHKLTHNSKLPFTIPVGKPETVGADRLALLAAAVELYPDHHNLIIGLGSCITYNFINRFHQFLGGSISPGMEMRFKAMHDYTALLPLEKDNWNFPLIGYDTTTNLTSGVILGMSKEIDGMIDEYNCRYSKFNVLLTGGDTAIFTPHLKNKIFADPYLIYKGLYAISEANQ